MSFRRAAARATGVVPVVGLLAALALGLFVPSAAAASGELRVLYVLATWGPTPFTHAQVEQVAAESDRFFQDSSSGRLSMPGTVVGPIVLPRPVFDSCNATALRSELPASTFAGYERVAFVTPVVPACPFVGEADPAEVLLNGQVYPALTVHELGHTLGLAHASTWRCSGGACSVDEYGNELSPMGSGYGDFNAYEKAELEWLTGLVRPAAGTPTYEIGPIEGPTTLPQALVVTTASTEYWFESRGRPSPEFLGQSQQAAGVAVTVAPFLGSQTASPYPRSNLLLPNPGGGGRFAYTAGETFVLPGIFAVVIERHAPESALLRLEWRDRVAPSRPALRVRVTRRGRVRLEWEPARDRGSGVATYTVLADGRPVRTTDGAVPYLNVAATLRLSPGSHRVGVYATDRAGNRGRAALGRVRVPS